MICWEKQHSGAENAGRFQPRDAAHGEDGSSQRDDEGHDEEADLDGGAVVEKHAGVGDSRAETLDEEDGDTVPDKGEYQGLRQNEVSDGAVIRLSTDHYSGFNDRRPGVVFKLLAPDRISLPCRLETVS